MNTLLLDPQTWDLMVDASNNIAMASSPYSIAQDVASELKLFQGELYYNANRGMPYFDEILAQTAPYSVLAKQAEIAALTVPEVVQAKCTSLYYANRALSGVVEVIDQAGAAQNISF